MDRKAAGLTGCLPRLAVPGCDSADPGFDVWGLFGRVKAAVSTGESGKQEGPVRPRNVALGFLDERGVYH